jgi:hypothetical protein
MGGNMARLERLLALGADTLLMAMEARNRLCRSACPPAPLARRRGGRAVLQWRRGARSNAIRRFGNVGQFVLATDRLEQQLLRADPAHRVLGVSWPSFAPAVGPFFILPVQMALNEDQVLA